MSPTSFQTALPRAVSSFLMGREGFEPSKALPADLQSVPFGHSGICPFFLGKPDFIYHCLLKADERTRTVNLLITNQLLCQLSHIGILNFCNKPLCSIGRAKLRLIALLLLTCVNKPKLSHIGLLNFLNKHLQLFYSCKPLLSIISLPFGSGTYRARTCDPLLVRQVLSQLS